MNDKKIKCVLLAVVFFTTISFVSNFAFAYCTPDDWWVCEGNYAVHYVIDSDCNTYSNSMYCQYGCSAGQCLSGCTPGYLNNYQCSGNWRQRQYQNADCSLVWNNYEYCSYGCSAGYCTSQCSEGYTGNYICSGNWKQGEYRYTDCRIEWRNIEYCNNGCSAGQCLSGCTAKYLDNYQCSGNWRQRQYQNADCSLVWNNYEYCSYGCSSGYCTQCTEGSTSNYRCSGNWRQGEYRYSDCRTEWKNIEYCIYSCSAGQCLSGCTPGYLDNYQCSGNWRQRQYQNADCSLIWQNHEYCNNGCSAGQCLTPQVCTPGQTRNYVCTCSTRYQYERCNPQGTGWVIETGSCSSGQVCENGYCVARCEAKYLDNYQCSGNWRQRQYQNADCSLVWNNYEYCANGCSAGQCLTPRCEAKYLDVWRCSGNWRERQYQNADCSLVWQNYEYCSYGCSGNLCLSGPSCEARYLDNYQCSGNWRQRQYQNSDCSLVWNNNEYCSYGCSSGYCVSRPCYISASLTALGDVYLGNSIYTTVSFYNSGDAGGNVNFVAYVCRSDGSSCQAMSCDGFDPYVYVPSYSTRSFSCSKTANELSLHKIRLDYSGCDRADPIIYSAVFDVKSYPACAAGYLNNFQCSGSWKQQQYQFADCRTEWRNVLYCDYSCSAGQCTEAPKHGIPQLSVEPEYAVQRCERNKFTFEISNTGEATDTFEISFSGSADRWIQAVSSVSLDPQQTRRITAYASVPCSAEGEYDLTVVATNGKRTSTATVLAVEDVWLPITGWMSWTGWTGWPAFFKSAVYALLFLLVIGVVFILLLLFVWRTPERREGPESFRQIINSARKKPESFTSSKKSFAERWCHHR